MSCKVYTDCIDFYGVYNGRDIYNFLMQDAGKTFDLKAEELIVGDCNLWYFGCNEKFGYIEYGYSADEEKTEKIHWGFEESSFENVEKLVRFLYDEGIFSIDQFNKLSEKINEGKLIGNIYNISDYLISKK